MTTPEEPKEERTGDPRNNLEERWEAVLRGEATAEEVAAVRRDIIASDRRAEFEAQAEVSAAVRGLATRHRLSDAMRARLQKKAGISRNIPENWKRWAAAGALAAMVVIAVGLTAILRQPGTQTPGLFAAVAREARAEYQRVLLDPRPVQTGSTELEKILGWFEPRVAFRPRVFFGGNGGTVLEGGRVGYVSGVKVPGFLYRREEKPLVLIILPTKDNPDWAKIPRKKWTLVPGEGPRTCVWRRGDYIYAIVGDASEVQLSALSKSITPPGEKI